ncbi:hypothetical protein IKE97_02190 [Candidatus Saccharibacteria bacterium]|nr:hypothetical protein [Candidatus Saccharibacteria bacterium]
MRRKVLCSLLVIALVLLLGLIIGNRQSFASDSLTDEEYAIRSQNSLFFIDNCDGSGGSGEACGITVSGETIEEKVWSGLTTFLSDEQAAGVMGNMTHESGLNPARHETSFINASPNFDIAGNSSTSYGLGLIQWSFGRRVNLYNTFKDNNIELWNTYIDEGRQEYGKNVSGAEFLEKAGDDVTNEMLAIELCRLKQEFDSNSVYGGIYNTKTVQEAADYFLERVEVPGNIEGTRPGRRESAQEFYDKLHGEEISGEGSSGDPSCSGKIEGSKNINATAVALAWPEGTSKDDYEWGDGGPTALFKKALGDVYPNHKHWDEYRRVGASCDVFVGTVVRYSGYDKDFPDGSGKVLDYVSKNKDLWERLDYDGKKSSIQAGDVLYRISTNKDGKKVEHVEIAVRDEENELWVAKAGWGSTYGHIDSFSNPKYIIRAKSAKNSTDGVSVKDGVSESNSTGKVTMSGPGNGDIGASALELAWPLGKDSDAASSATKRFAKYYIEEVDPSNSVEGGKSCDRFVTTAVRYSGVDKNFEMGSVPTLLRYVEGSDDWEKVEIDNVKKLDKYESGDVVFYYKSGSNSPEHVGIYAEDANGTGYDVSASLGDRYGLVRDSSFITNTSYHTGKRVVYRNKNNKKGTSSCNVCAGKNGNGDIYAMEGLKNMSLSEAEAFMKPYHDAAMGEYYKKDWRRKTIMGGMINGLVNCPFGIMNNCVAFSQWFVNRYTTLGPNWDHTATGGEMAHRLGEYGFETGTEPQLFAVFSTYSPWTHTGVVLGIDEKAKKMVIGEASCSEGKSALYYEPHAVTITFAEAKSKGYNYAYAGKKLKDGALSE